MFSNSLVITIYYDILSKLLIGPSSQFRVEKDESPPPFTFSDNSHFPSPHIFWRRGTASISFGNIRRKKDPVTTPPELIRIWHIEQGYLPKKEPKRGGQLGDLASKRNPPPKINWAGGPSSWYTWMEKIDCQAKTLQTSSYRYIN